MARPGAVGQALAVKPESGAERPDRPELEEAPQGLDARARAVKLAPAAAPLDRLELEAGPQGLDARARAVKPAPATAAQRVEQELVAAALLQVPVAEHRARVRPVREAIAAFPADVLVGGSRFGTMPSAAATGAGDVGAVLGVCGVTGE
jgi:hypothetical protein